MHISRIYKEFSNRKLNILTMACHERYQSNMRDINADFYLLNFPGSKKWNKEYAEIPKNHFILKENLIPGDIKFDIVLSQSRYAHYQILSEVAKKLQIPLITLEHTIPTNDISKENLQILKSMTGYLDIYISEFNKKVWDIGNLNCIIPHGIDTNLFFYSNEDKDNVVLAVQNDYINRDYCLGYTMWKNVATHFKHVVVGNTPGLSKAAKNTEELIKHYHNSLIYFNTAHASPIPMSLLEAMACGCCVVSVNTCDIPSYIKNGETGFLISSEKEAEAVIKDLLNDPQKAKNIGKKASEFIKQKCNLKKFTNNWNQVLGDVYENKI